MCGLIFFNIYIICGVKRTTWDTAVGNMATFPKKHDGDGRRFAMLYPGFLGSWC